MLYSKFEYAEGGKLAPYFRLSRFFALCGAVFNGEFICNSSFFAVALHDSYCSESNDALEISREFFRNYGILRHDAETRFTASVDCIELMSAFGTMERDFPVFIAVIQRHGVRVAAVARKGKYACFAVF